MAANLVVVFSDCPGRRSGSHGVITSAPFADRTIKLRMAKIVRVSIVKMWVVI